MSGGAVAARAALLKGPREPFRLSEVELAAPREDELLVRLASSGICHTDLNVWHGYYQTPWPIVLGHEGAGVVEQVGAEVTDVHVGDHVVLSYASCGHCPRCGGGEPAYCLQFLPLNLTGYRGDWTTAMNGPEGPVPAHFFGQSSFATHSVVNRRNAVPIRKDVPLEQMAPLGCGIQTGAGTVLNTLKVGAGARVAVFGTGAVGLSAVMAAVAAGAAEVVAVDIRADRLDLARRLGASRTIDAGSEDAAAILMADGGMDYAIECSGRPEVVEQAFAALATRGTLAVVGAPPPGSTAKFDLNNLLLGGRQVRGVMEGDSVPQELIPKLIDLYVQGRFPFTELARTYPFDEIDRAVADCLSGSTVKPILLMDGASA